MQEKIRKGLTAVFAVMLLVGIAGMARSYIGYGMGRKEYSAAEEIAGLQHQLPSASTEQEAEQDVESKQEESVSETDPTVSALQAINWTALQETNSDVLGWIQIPDMQLSYPVLLGTDNDYYLHHTWQKNRNSAGSIFVDYRNGSDLTDFNTIIYGHNMKNGSMFGELDLFRNEAYLKEHPYVYIADQNGCRRYHIFAAYEVSVSTAESYRLLFADDTEKQKFLDDCLALSDVNAGIVPSVNDRIITLSTCTGRGYTTRWVVQAVLDLELPHSDVAEMQV